MQPETPEGLLALIFNFEIIGQWLYPKDGRPRRLATDEERAMWAALKYQATKLYEETT